MAQKKIMILGAGFGQLPFIKKAIELGYYVITLDYLPDNIGHKFSHQAVNCSTVDKEAVLVAAQKLKIDGIITFASDVATPTLGYVAEQLGLAGGSFNIALTMSNKAHFRAFQRDHQMDSPRFVVGDTLPEIEKSLHTLTAPVMFKPVDTSGSRGISRVDKLDNAGCQKAFDYAHKYSRSGLVCVEEYIEGIDVSGDGFLVDGHLSAVITHKHKNGYVPTGHGLPTNISAADQTRIFAEVAANCRALGYTNGPLDFDVRISPEHATIIEMSPRLGGNCIPAIVTHATDFDLMATTLHFALGEPFSAPKTLEVKQSCGSWLFGSPFPGRLESIAAEEDLRRAVPEVFEYAINYQTGDKVPRFVHSNDILGYVLFDCPPGTTYPEIAERLQKSLNLRVNED